MEVCELFKLIPKEKLDYLFRHSDAGADLDCTFLGFEEVYKRVMEHVPQEYTILDLGCAYATQSWYFRDHARYIGVDGWGNPDSVIHTENSEFYFMRIQEFLRDVYSGLDLDHERVFAICSYVPDREAQQLVVDTFSHCLVCYPGSISYERFPGDGVPVVTQGMKTEFSEERNMAMKDVKILSFEECMDASYGNTVVQFQVGDVISFAFSGVDFRMAVKDPGLLMEDIKRHDNFDAKRPLWSELSEDLRKVVLDNPFDMQFFEFDDPDWNADKADGIWEEACRLGLEGIVTRGEDDCYMTVYAGTMGSINWNGHEEYGVPCFDIVVEEKESVQPYRIVITETFVREVEIYAADNFAAQEIAEELCNEGIIDLNADDFQSRDTECRGVARPNDLALHEHYDKNGKIENQKVAPSTPQVSYFTYEPKFIDGKTAAELYAELEKMNDDEYRFGRAIDRPRMWDIQYTMQVLAQQKAQGVREPLDDVIQSCEGMSKAPEGYQQVAKDVERD